MNILRFTASYCDYQYLQGFQGVYLAKAKYGSYICLIFCHFISSPMPFVCVLNNVLPGAIKPQSNPPLKTRGMKGVVKKLLKRVLIKMGK